MANPLLPSMTQPPTPPGHSACPRCEDAQHTKQVAMPLLLASVAYYRCGSCGHVWVIRPDGHLSHVTSLRPDQEKLGK